MKNQIKNLLLTSVVPLTLADRRLYNYLLHHAFSVSLKKPQFTIVLSELAGVYSAGQPSLQNLKDSLMKLMCTQIEFELNGKWVLTSLLAKAELGDKLLYAYPDTCKLLLSDPLLLEQCLIQAHFMLKYSNLLYELLASSHYKNKADLSLEINTLRQQLQVPAGKLTNYNDFDRFVLIPAVNEINSYASFAVKYFTERKGMKVIAVKFEMSSKRNITTIKEVIPVKRPRLFIDDPALERAYSYLLNAETKLRRKYFDLACKNAHKKNEILDEAIFDRPDLWLKWIAVSLMKKVLKGAF